MLYAASVVSNTISKKMCVLEIDLEIAAALPDKGHRSYREFLSKSPDIFASGGTTRSRTALPSGNRAYANTSVGTFVGIYEVTSSRWLVQRSDMNSVGDQPCSVPSGFTTTPAQATTTVSSTPDSKSSVVVENRGSSSRYCLYGRTASSAVYILSASTTDPGRSRRSICLNNFR